MVVYIQFALYLIINPIFKILFRPVIKGAENFPQKPFIIAANHASKLDAFLFFLLPFWEGKKIIPLYFATWEFYHSKWYFRFILKSIGSFPIPDKAWTLEDYLKSSLEQLSKGRTLIFFPEGGIAREDKRPAPKPGLGYLTHKSGKLVVPLHIEWTDGKFGQSKLKMIFGKIILPLSVGETMEDYRNFTKNTMEVIYKLRS